MLIFIILFFRLIYRQLQKNLFSGGNSMQYKVVCVEEISTYSLHVICSLNSEVRKFLNEGWKPQGGVSISKTPAEISSNNVVMKWYYCVSQALIKE